MGNRKTDKILKELSAPHHIVNPGTNIEIKHRYFSSCVDSNERINEGKTQLFWCFCPKYSVNMNIALTNIGDHSWLWCSQSTWKSETISLILHQATEYHILMAAYLFCTIINVDGPKCVSCFYFTFYI